MLEFLVPNARELGVLNALLYGIDRVCVKAGLPARVLRYVLVAQPVAPEPLLPPRRGRSIEVRRVSPRDRALTRLEYTEANLDEPQSRDAACFAAYRNGAIVGSLFLLLGPYEETEVRCRFVPTPEGRAAWDYRVYVMPDQRPSLAFARLWDEANAYLRERGVPWSFSRISAYDPVSLTSHARLAARPIGSAVYVRLGPLQVMVSTLAPRLHVSWRDDRAPTVVLPPPGDDAAPG